MDKIKKADESKASNQNLGEFFMNSLFALLALCLFTASAFALPTFTPQLVLKNQQGETSVNYVQYPGTTFIGGKIAANSIPSNLTGSIAYPIANTYAAVSAKLTPAMLLTGFAAGAGTVSATDTVLQGFNKLAGNTQNLAVINNLLTGFTAGAGSCSASDSIKVCMQKLAGNVAAHQANSAASDVAGLVVDFNALLAKLQAANLMAP